MRNYYEICMVNGQWSLVNGHGHGSIFGSSLSFLSAAPLCQLGGSLLLPHSFLYLGSKMKSLKLAQHQPVESLFQLQFFQPFGTCKEFWSVLPLFKNNLEWMFYLIIYLYYIYYITRIVTIFWFQQLLKKSFASFCHFSTACLLTEANNGSSRTKVAFHQNHRFTFSLFPFEAFTRARL